MNEAYERTPLRGCAAAEEVPSTGCAKTGVQCVNISQPVVLTPTATVGTVTATCQGAPTVSCVTNAGNTACTVTLTQRLCAVIPITYGVAAASGDPSIGCAATSGADNGQCACSCGCAQ